MFELWELCFGTTQMIERKIFQSNVWKTVVANKVRCERRLTNTEKEMGYRYEIRENSSE